MIRLLKVVVPDGSEKWFGALLVLLSSSAALIAADRSPTIETVNAAVFSCGNRLLTTNEVLTGRYPDPEILNVPDACKERARQLLAQWRKDDLANLELIFEQACSAQGGSYERLLLEQALVKAGREEQLQDAACDCYGETLASLTNAPVAPSGLTIASQTGLTGEKGPQTTKVAVRFSPGVAAKRAETGIARNAEELARVLSPKTNANASAESRGYWMGEYKKALDLIVADTHRIETLSMELGPGVNAPPATSKDLLGLRQKLAGQAQTLGTAFDGLTRERELPRGECQEAFAIRHQLLLQFLHQLIDSPKR